MAKNLLLNIFKIILTFSLLYFSNEICTLGGNCPLDQGMCVGEFCKCLDGFYSLLDPSLLPSQQIYCNYEQINVYIPLIMEIFLPSSGHFYVGKYWLGSLKLFLLILFALTSYSVYGNIMVPKIVMDVISKLGISLKSFLPEGLLGESKEEKDDGEEGNEIDNGKNLDPVPISKLILRSNQKNLEKVEKVEQAHNEDKNDVYSPELEEKFIIHKEENQEENEENEEKEVNKFIKFLYYISISFWILYFGDLYCYKFKVYNDGNDVPFVE